MEFEWDEEKRRTNVEKHQIDFDLADIVFDGRPIRTSASSYPDEERFLTTTIVEDRFVTLVWTLRDRNIRVISLRRSRRAEERAYRALHK